jgi:RNase H-fold protein (predicted Holliday junction resolvase)
MRKAFTVPIDTENEVLTTKMAKSVGVPARHLDAASAALILQSYLDKKHK